MDSKPIVWDSLFEMYIDTAVKRCVSGMILYLYRDKGLNPSDYLVIHK